MRKKILGIVIIGLLIATSFSAVGTTITEKKLPETLSGQDQKQTHQDGSGFNIVPAQWLAQGFKPSKDKLVAVQLYIFKHDNPPEGVEITVSIRDKLNGSDLTVITENADQIKTYKWVTFDFPDISVSPEEQYYIVCRSDGGSGLDVYCWFYGNNNPYDRGAAWSSADQGLNWVKFTSGRNYQDPDFCFKTYSEKSRERTIGINTIFLRFLENFPNTFPILRYIFGL
jgi:hypothetical protein